MRKRPLFLISVSLGLALWVAGLGCWPLFQWSPLNCSYQDIDIHSGRIRRQHIVLGVRVSSSVEETSVSRLLAQGGLAAPVEWRRVNTFSPMVNYSPHHRYHGAISQIRRMEMMWQFVSFAPEVRRQMAGDVVALWQEDLGDSVVDDYLDEVDNRLSQKTEPKTITRRDLPLVTAIMKRQREREKTHDAVGELLKPEVLKTLTCSFCGIRNNQGQRTNSRSFSATDPMAEEARKLLLWLMSLENVEDVEGKDLPSQGSPDRHITLYRETDDDKHDVYFQILVYPEPGEPIYVRGRASIDSRQFVTLRLVKNDKQVSKRIDDLYDSLRPAAE